MQALHPTQSSSCTQYSHRQPSMICRDAADDLGLKRAPAKDPANPEPFAVYDGQHFVFNQSAWSVVTLYRMLRRYG